MRPIDANALLETIQEKRMFVFSSPQKAYMEGYTIKSILSMEKLVKEAPTVERPRGEWIKTFRYKGEDINTGTILSLYYYDCPKCKYRTGNQGKEFYFCPNCGADMRGEGE